MNKYMMPIKCPCCQQETFRRYASNPYGNAKFPEMYDIHCDSCGYKVRKLDVEKALIIFSQLSQNEQLKKIKAYIEEIHGLYYERDILRKQVSCLAQECIKMTRELDKIKTEKLIKESYRL